MREATKRHRHEAKNAATADGPRPSSLRRSVAPSLSSAAFTLTELLIVISIIVLILAMAVPAFNYLTGARSLEAAENQLSATIARAREEALGLQQPRGVAFFTDAASQRVTIALVRFVPYPFPFHDFDADYLEGEYVFDTGGNAYVSIQRHTNQPLSDGNFWQSVNADIDPRQIIDRVPDRSFVVLPRGVAMQSVTDSDPDSRYLEMGAMIFDGRGRLVVRPYRFARDGVIGRRVNLAEDFPPDNRPSAFSQLGFVLYEREPYDNQSLDPFEREQWLDEHALPILINRYNGRLLRGE